MTVMLWVAACALVIIGLAGTILPALPGAPLVYLGLLLAAWIDGFQRVGWVTLAVLAMLVLVSFAVEILVTGHGARRSGASRAAVIGASVGTIVGLFFGIPGLVVGPFLGAVGGELLATRDLAQAGRAGIGAWLGIAVGVGAKLALVFMMIGIFVVSYFL
ncbi:MAG: DUF456 domain-containing protein [Desulfuromonadales bacterium]|nr:MAG: DUF456 domain-containing protein [Desulfuromonadales bacterium]